MILDLFELSIKPDLGKDQGLVGRLPKSPQNPTPNLLELKELSRIR